MPAGKPSPRPAERSESASRPFGCAQGRLFYRWRQEYGGLRIDQVKRLKELETENSRLKRAVADLTLDKLILREAAEGNF